MATAPFLTPLLALLAFSAILGGWIRHCYRAMDTAHPWLDPMPLWRRIAFEPTLVLVASTPILIVLIFWLGLAIYVPLLTSFAIS